MNKAALTMLNKAHPLPASMQKLGLVPASQLRKTHRLMLGTDGLTNTGKTEFLLSAPGPKVILPLDASYDSTLDNPYPPISRRLDDAAFDEIKIPMSGTLTQPDFVKYFQNYRTRLYNLLEVPEIRTIAIDGDETAWELQLLAEFGKISQIPPMAYQMVDGAKRAMIKRCWESEKIIIATHKIKDKWEDVLDENGNPILEERSGKNKQRKAIGEYKRQGFRDQDYLWQIQIRHMYRPGETIDLSTLLPAERLRAKREGRARTLPQWGLKIMKCKPNTRLEGDELWGDDCNFKGLVRYIYPQIPLTEWGFEKDE